MPRTQNRPPLAPRYEADAARDSDSRALLPWLLALFVCSGIAALIYEIVWFQLLELVIGSTAVSLGVLLATYMGGMCVGSLLLPRIPPAPGAPAAPLRIPGARDRHLRSPRTGYCATCERRLLGARWARSARDSLFVADSGWLDRLRVAMR
jgi:hypothetical protein